MSFLNDFERTYSRCSDHRIELRAGSSIETDNSDRLKSNLAINHMPLLWRGFEHLLQ